MRNLSVLMMAALIAALPVVSCAPQSQPDNPDDPGNTDNPNQPTDPQAPVIELTGDGQVTFSFEEGESNVDYTIVNPVEGGVLAVAVPDGNTWITAEVQETSIRIAVSENSDTEARSEMLTLTYTYADASVKGYINVIQDAAEYDYVIDATSCTCTWYGNPERNPEMTNYNLLLKTTDGVIVSLDLLAPEETSDHLAPAGEYSAYQYGTEEGLSMSVGENAYSYLYKVLPSFDYEYDVTVDLGSTVTIGREEDVFTVKAAITAYETGQTFLVRYTGEMVADNGFINSSLKEDFSKTYNAAELGVIAQGGSYTYAGTNLRYWTVYIGPEEYKLGDPYVFLEFFTDEDKTTPDWLPGVYTANPDFEANPVANSFIPGYTGYGGTWFAEVGEITNISAYAGAEAPIMTGTFELKLRPNLNFDLIIDGFDDNYESPNHVHVEITNIDFGLND